MISHRERLETCLSGERPDRTPVALWRHFPVDDQTPGGLAAATVAFQRAYDFDLVKVTPASSFCIKDWGAQDEWRGATEGTRDYVGKVIQTPEDWIKLPALDPLAGKLGEQLECLRLLAAELGDEVPIIQTIFSPLAQAKNLAGRETVLVHMRQNPDALQVGLKVIAESTQKFVEAALETGIDGIFYATQHAQFSLLSIEEHDIFGRPYDLQILEPAQDAWLNMLHLHGYEVMFDQVVDYPVQIINWHDRETQPSLAEAQKQFSGVVCGGLQRNESMVYGTPDSVRAQARDAIEATGGRRFILGTGCVTPIIAPHGNILAARQVVDG